MAIWSHIYIHKHLHIICMYTSQLFFTTFKFRLRSSTPYHCICEYIYTPITIWTYTYNNINVNKCKIPLNLSSWLLSFVWEAVPALEVKFRAVFICAVFPLAVLGFFTARDSASWYLDIFIYVYVNRYSYHDSLKNVVYICINSYLEIFFPLLF